MYLQKLIHFTNIKILNIMIHSLGTIKSKNVDEATMINSYIIDKNYHFTHLNKRQNFNIVQLFFICINKI